ncbi:autophagy-related protein [Lipomyces japonicus]|uniref:autophagy-related protein n=1 Tax=Lipomyces japonicus TaxID=56871 RepID=UPI0034CE1837
MLQITIDIVLDKLLVREVLKAVLSSIFFYRVFGQVKPLVPTREVLDITYASIEDAVLEAQINDKLTLLNATLEASSQNASNLLPTNNLSAKVQGQVCIAFYEKKTKKAWFSKSEEEVCWEKWVINVTSINPRTDSDRNKMAKSTESQLQNIMFKIIDIVNENKDHIPPITTTETNPFPYQILLPSSTDESWGAVFKKILVE